MTFAWTNHQVRNLRAFVAQGMGDEAIAARLGRSTMAVRRHRYGLGLLRARRRIRLHPPTPEPRVEKLTISKGELPAFYEVGWRVEWHEGDQVGLVREVRG